MCWNTALKDTSAHQKHCTESEELETALQHCADTAAYEANFHRTFFARACPAEPSTWKRPPYNVCLHARMNYLLACSAEGCNQ